MCHDLSHKMREHKNKNAQSDTYQVLIILSTFPVLELQWICIFISCLGLAIH